MSCAIARPVYISPNDRVLRLGLPIVMLSTYVHSTSSTHLILSVLGSTLELLGIIRSKQCSKQCVEKVAFRALRGQIIV